MIFSNQGVLLLEVGVFKRRIDHTRNELAFRIVRKVEIQIAPILSVLRVFKVSALGCKCYYTGLAKISDNVLMIILPSLSFGSCFKLFMLRSS